MKPQLKQKTIEQIEPSTQRMRAISLRGMSLNEAASATTVAVASNVLKLESIPRVKRVRPRMNAHAFGAGIVSIAAGYATNARPREVTSSETGEP